MVVWSPLTTKALPTRHLVPAGMSPLGTFSRLTLRLIAKTIDFAAGALVLDVDFAAAGFAGAFFFAAGFAVVFSVGFSVAGDFAAGALVCAAC